MADETKHDAARCSHPLNQLHRDSHDARGSICGACGEPVAVRLPDGFYPEDRDDSEKGRQP